MSLLIQLQEDMRTAMKSGEKDRLSVLRLVLSAISYVSIDSKDELSDEDVIKVLRTEAKKRKESIEAYTKAGREDSAKKEREELTIIESYLPALMSEEDVKVSVEKILSGSKFDSFGLAMNAVMQELKGKADGSLVSRYVKDIYQQ